MPTEEQGGAKYYDSRMMSSGGWLPDEVLLLLAQLLVFISGADHGEKRDSSCLFMLLVIQISSITAGFIDCPAEPNLPGHVKHRQQWLDAFLHRAWSHRSGLITTRPWH